MNPRELGSSGQGPERAWYGDWAAFTLLVLSWGFLFSGAFQLFPLPGWVDAGLYQGYGLSLPALVRRYAFKHYHGSRLPYVLVLYLCHRIASIEVAQYLQILFFHAMALLSLLAGTYRHFGRGPALLGAAFLGFNPLFLSALTQGGADGASLSYLLLALALFFSPSGMAGSYRMLVAAGVACACAGVANPFVISPLLGLFAAYRLAAGPRWPGPGGYVALLLGGASMLVVLGLVARAVGMKFFFLGYSATMTRRLAHGFGAKYLVPLHDWLFSNYRMLVPVILGLSALALLRARPEVRRNRLFIAAACLAPLVPFVLQLAANLAGQAQLVQGRHYFTLLLPGLAFSVVALSQAAPLPTPRYVLAPAILLGLPAALVAMGLVSPAGMGPYARVVFFSMLGLGALFALLTRLGKGREGSPFVYAGVLLCTVCFSLSEDSLQVYRVTTGDDYKEAFLGAGHLVRVLEESGLAERKPMFWFPRGAENVRSGLASTFRHNYEGNLTHLNYFDTLVSYYLWDQSLLGASFDTLEPATLDRFLARPLVFLAPSEPLLTKALSRVAALGYSVDDPHWLSYPGRRFGWVAVTLEISRGEPSGSRSGSAPSSKEPVESVQPSALRPRFER